MTTKKIRDALKYPNLMLEYKENG